MIVITGAAGFIASCVISDLITLGYHNLIAVDAFNVESKAANLQGKSIQKIERSEFVQWLSQNGSKVSAVIHLGARTDTTEMDVNIFDALNLNYSKAVWSQCVAHKIPLIYASSAATYGGGEHGYTDDHEVVNRLCPLNPYGDSKQLFDKWVLKQEETPPFWAGLKFFNVYGPNEYHKGRMASVILHTFRQIAAQGEMKLFRSHNPKYGDGQQMRDFVYVKDVASVITFLLEKKPLSGLYNLGSGQARTFLDLATFTFQAQGLTPKISFVDTPLDIRDKYQYFTEANMSKLLQVGYNKPFHTLENGVEDYVKNFLIGNKYY